MTRDQLEEICTNLQALQRQRVIVMKSRTMQSNRLQALVAGTLGYNRDLEEKERTKKFTEAAKLIKQVNDEEEIDNPLLPIIKGTLVGINIFNDLKKGFEKQMEKEAKKLPVHTWVARPEQRGFGTLFLGIVIGETGNLYRYENWPDDDERLKKRGGITRCGGVYKLYKRLGCAPWKFNLTGEPGGEKCFMGATWRSGQQGKLPASEWEKFGYSPRRRSISYLIGEGLMKQNFIFDKSEESKIAKGTVALPQTQVDEEGLPEALAGEGVQVLTVEDPPKKDKGRPGPYRKEYEDARAAVKLQHPEYPDLRCHRHGMLLATKLFLANLWCVWRELCR